MVTGKNENFQSPSQNNIHREWILKFYAKTTLKDIEDQLVGESDFFRAIENMVCNKQNNCFSDNQILK